jgi:hypothetical protein
MLGKPFMSPKFIARSIVSVTVCLLALACDGIQPQRVTATGTISGTDGISQPTSQIFTLKHDVGEAPTARVVTRRILINNVTGFSLAVTRTGIPIDETC